MGSILYLVDQYAREGRSAEERHPGGAELVDEALFEAAPERVEPVRWRELRLPDLEAASLVVVGNMQTADRERVRAVAETGRHVLVEHDLRICRWRGNFYGTRERLHRLGHWCFCAHPHLHDLYDRSLGSIFYSHRQLEHFHRNPFYRSPRELVLGCPPLRRSFFERVDALRASGAAKDLRCCVVASPNEIKGGAEAERECRSWGVEPRVIRDRPHEEVLDLFSRTRTFVYLPKGLEAGGRTLVEARLLGCRVVTNGNSGVCGESWWHLGREAATEVARDAAPRFWRLVEHLAREGEGRAPLPARRTRGRRSRRWERGLETAARGLPVARSALGRRVEARQALREVFDDEAAGGARAAVPGARPAER